MGLAHSLVTCVTERSVLHQFVNILLISKEHHKYSFVYLLCYRPTQKPIQKYYFGLCTKLFINGVNKTLIMCLTLDRWLFPS